MRPRDRSRGRCVRQEQEPSLVPGHTATTPEPQRMNSFSHTPKPDVSPSAVHTVLSVPTAGTPVAEAPQCPWSHLSPPYGFTMDCPLGLDTQLGCPLPQSLALRLTAEALMLTDHEPGPASFPGYSHLCPWVITATGGPRGLKDSSAKHSGPRNRHAAPGTMPRLSLDALGRPEKGRRVLTESELTINVIPMGCLVAGGTSDRAPRLSCPQGAGSFRPVGASRLTQEGQGQEGTLTSRSSHKGLCSQSFFHKR